VTEFYWLNHLGETTDDKAESSDFKGEREHVADLYLQYHGTDASPAYVKLTWNE